MASPHTPKTPFSSSDSSTTLATTVAPVESQNKPKKSCCQGCGSLRWRLARGLLGRSLPWLTAHCNLKLGDLLITAPLVLAPLGLSVHLTLQHDVKNSGWVAGAMILITLFLTVRNSSVILALTGLSYERALFYHKIFGTNAMALTLLHLAAHLLKADSPSDGIAKYVWSGWVMLGMMALLVVTSLPFVRRYSYELFLHAHWISILTIFAMSFFHGTELIVGVGLKFCIMDRVYSRIIRPRRLRNDSKKDGAIVGGLIAPDQVTAVRLSDDMVCIQFPRVRADTDKAFEYQAGQYAYLSVAALGRRQWHPFVISSAPHEPLVTFHIKVNGDWTRKLMDMMANASNATLSPLEIGVDGPYGHPCIEINNPETYAHVVLIAGGVGILPMKAMANSLHYQHYHQDRHALESVSLIWTVSDRALVQAMMTNTQPLDAAEDGMASYFPNLLLSNGHNLDQVFRTEIFSSEGCDLENPMDQALQPYTRYNTQMDTAAELRQMGDSALIDGKTRVAVLVSGPAELITTVVSQSIRLSRETGVQFDVHWEPFQV